MAASSSSSTTWTTPTPPYTQIVISVEEHRLTVEILAVVVAISLVLWILSEVLDYVPTSIVPESSVSRLVANRVRQFFRLALRLRARNNVAQEPSQLPGSSAPLPEPTPGRI